MSLMKASIDIGSNSILLLGGTFEDQKFIEEINEAEVAGLGKDIDKNGYFEDDRMETAFNILEKYKEILKEKEVSPSEVILTATEASRVASNSKGFFEKIKNKLGFDIKVISAEGEAYYTAYGVSLDHSVGENFTIMDLGGASTELIKVNLKPFEINESISLPLGSVRATDWLDSGDFSTNLSSILSSNESEIKKYKGNSLVCVAGTMTTMAAVILGLDKYQDADVQGKIIEMALFKNTVKDLEGLTSGEILTKYPLAGKRSTSLYGGGLVALEIGKVLETPSFSISTYGLRYGTLASGGLDENFVLS